MQEDFLGEVTVPTEAEVEEGTAAEKKAMRKLMTLNVDAHDDLIPSMPDDSEAGRVVLVWSEVPRMMKLGSNWTTTLSH